MGKITLYKNGAITKALNRKGILEINEVDNTIHLTLLNLDRTDDVNKPACRHRVLKNKVRVTDLKITIEGFELLLEAYFELKKIKENENLAISSNSKEKQ